jgi:pseudouridine-5'-phosphate glycosidase
VIPGTPDAFVCSPAVAAALAERRPVVALESTILSHGLPRPRNHEVGLELEEAVRAGGATPATIAVLDGVAHVGLDDEQLERITADESLRKISQRDLPMAGATKSSGGTTVSATAALAAAAGVRVFATGGLGGVHRGWHDSWDESADLLTLSQTRITVVSAGVKSVLDIGATLQRLETLNVGVVGFRTDTFPAFYLRSSGYAVDWRVESAADVAAIMAAQDRLGLPQGALLVANPLPSEAELDQALHDRVLTEALVAADTAGVTGQPLTPFLLQYMLDGTDGASLEANLAAVRSNVAVATEIAVSYTSET